MGAIASAALAAAMEATAELAEIASQDAWSVLIANGGN